MPLFRFGAQPLPLTPELRWRHRFTLLTFCTTIALIAWGGFVTSIDAGLAVPDWPTSFDSYDPFNPWPDWWTVTPILAEHGHRLLGALVGLFTLILAAWTWLKDPRGWMRKLGIAALVLVILQGTLGGLRVVLVSLDLAMVHAGVAQVFFALIAAMALFTAPRWLAAEALPADPATTPRLRRITLLTIAALYGQILLGALLRHPGAGISPTLAALHIGGAFVATAMVLASFLVVRWWFKQNLLLQRGGWALLGLLGLQLLLGLVAYFVTLDEAGMLQPSTLQVAVNTTHLVVAALLLTTAVLLTLLAHRPASIAPEAAPAPRLQTISS